MTRLFAFLAAILVSGLAVSAATASAATTLNFSLEPSRSPGRVEARFTSGAGKHRSQWNSTHRPGELAGLDTAAYRGSGSRPVRFALVREAGRLDCSGTGRSSRASGACRFTPDPDYMAFLAANGVRRPTDEEALSLMSMNVRRDLVIALHQARYPAPDVGDLVSLTAIGVDGAYISGLARAGYRPASLDSLVEFRAIGVTPEWIRGFVQNGLSGMSPDELVQLKALDITGDYVASFRRVGYRDLSADQLVQMKALGVTADYARKVQQRGRGLPSPERLVEMKATGF